MCRANNTVSLFSNHLEWREDALGIYFTHTKSDQTGDRPKDPCHVYANPLAPEVCPILALGIYWLCFPFARGDGDTGVPIFQGSDQYERFRQVMGSFLSTPDGLEQLKAWGMELEDFGTHSMRKGATSYVSSGTTACPSGTAIHLRAGWSLGAVQDRYLRYEAAGDMHVGRTVAGLPPDRPEFAILPPFFVNRDEVVINAIEAFFPFCPKNLKRVVEFALASVVFHSDFLLQNCPVGHLLRETVLFRSPSIIASLKERIKCGLYEEGFPITPTGVPPHISVLKVLKDISSQFGSMQDGVINGIIQVLEERAIGAGTVTRDGLNNSIMACLEQAGLTALMNRLNSNQNANNNLAMNPVFGPENRQPQQFSFEWGGRPRPIPEDFCLPDGTILMAWQFWMIGDPEKGYPPYRTLCSADIASAKVKKRFSDFKFLMKKLEDAAQDRELLIDRPSVIQANEIFAQVSDQLNLNTENRRFNQMKWTAAVTTIRRKRPRTEENENNNDNDD